MITVSIFLRISLSRPLYFWAIEFRFHVIFFVSATVQSLFLFPTQRESEAFFLPSGRPILLLRGWKIARDTLHS